MKTPRIFPGAVVDVLSTRCCFLVVDVHRAGDAVNFEGGGVNT